MSEPIDILEVAKARLRNAYVAVEVAGIMIASPDVVAMAQYDAGVAEQDLRACYSLIFSVAGYDGITNTA